MKKLMRKLKVLAAVVAGVVAIGANAETFLEKLAADSHKVDSSPYASGGDIILHLNGEGYDDYVHAFTNTTAAATFTPFANIHARLLMVAGGGSGGGCNGSAISGGGGAGGLIYKDDLALTKDIAYNVTIGEGGVGVSGQAGGTSGKDTTFVGGDLDLKAVHGGGGGGWYNSPKSGGSGGGGSGGQNGTVYAPADGTAGQGYAGGAATPNACGGGGGGAGEPGHAAVESPNALRRAGDGGDGLAFDITGKMEYYAGGGGAGGNAYPNRAKGGLGGGGDGATRTLTPAVSGVDGKGGGGGGIIVNGVKSGKGGNGIVIVRYCVYSGKVPLLRPCVLEVTGGSVVEGTGAFAALGAGATSASATIKFTPKGGSTAPVKNYTLAEVTEGPLTTDSPFAFKLTGLAYDTEYDYAISAANGSASAVVQTGTLKTFSKSLAATATGGCDAIDVGEMDKAFVFTGDGTFTTSGMGYARVLVVGGGGGGGSISGGGGGGGGVYYNRAELLKPGTYAVKVGAGGKGATGNTYASDNASGQGSSFVGGDVNVAVLGGGRGTRWDDNVAAGNGGCGGGASGNRLNGSGEAGQGYDGGVSANSRGSGGGGATANGKSAGSASAGAGGAGFYIDITGEILDYGSGGGGGCSTQKGNQGAGGAAGGDGAGHGANSAVSTDDDKPSSGLNGRGGGGGGGNGAKYDGFYSGNGGCGTVIIRYTDYSLAGTNPIVNITEISDVGCNSADVSIDVPYAGDDADVTMTYAWGYTPDDLTLGSVTTDNFIGEVRYTIDRLSPNRKYYVVATARNSAGTAASTNSFTTLRMFSKPLALATTGGKLSYTIDGAAFSADTDTERLELYVGADADSLELRAIYDTAEFLSAGSHAVMPFSPEEYGSSWTMLFRHIATDGDYVFTNETAALTSTLQDAVTYKWNQDVADGDWNDPANWTSIGGMRGYPTVGSTADLTSANCATIHVASAVSIQQLIYKKQNAEYVFIGEGDGAQVVPIARGADGLATGQKFTVDNLLVWFKYYTTINVPSDAQLTVRNGGIAKVTKEDYLTSYQAIKFGGNAKLILGTGGSVLCNGYNSSGSGNAVDFIAAREGSALPMMTADTFPGSGTLTVNVPKNLSPIAMRPSKCDVWLVSASGAVNVSEVMFGATATPNGYFYFTDAEGNEYLTAAEVGSAKINGIWYRHRSTGFIVILK